MNQRARLPRPTDRIALGDGLAVSPFCVGIVREPETIEVAFDAGINFFFVSADMHWPLYEPTRRGLERLLARVPRDHIVVASAAYVTQPEFCRQPFQEVVDAVAGLGRLDVLVAGGAYADDLPARWPVFRRHRAMRFLDTRAIGSTFHDREAALAAVESGDFDIAFIRYNPGHPGAQRDLFPFLPAGRSKPLFGFNSTRAFDAAQAIPDDVWRPRITDHYRFALSRPELDGLLCSPSYPWMVQELVAAVDEGPLSPAEQEHLIELAALSES